ncbi:MAG: RNA polymerase sigma factor [Solirubrobacteraceae bacterium]|jgi:RNA polymerase sigma-70 factor (ECF subfamily)
MVAQRGGEDARLLAGGAGEFGAFYARHEADVLRFLLHRAGGVEQAADLCAETFARALEHRRSFDPSRGEARAWLFGIARHVLAASYAKGQVIDEARRRLALEPLLLDDADIARLERLADEPALQALEQLPTEQRDAVAGRVIDDRSYQDLAASLACSESVIRQRVSRGLRAIRDRLEGAR